MNLKMARTMMWVSVLLINLFGLVTIYSVTRYSNSGIQGSFKKQTFFLILSLVVTVLACRLPTRFWKILSPWAYVGTLISLVAVLIIGQKINGAQSWIRLPGISVQPSEFLKLSLVLALAQTLSIKREFSRLQDLFLVVLISAVPLLLVLKQPDLGTAMTLIPMIIGVTYLAGYNLPNMGLLIGYGSLAFMWLIISAICESPWSPIHSYQLGRIVRLFHQDDMTPLLSIGSIPANFILWTGVVLSGLAIWLPQSWKKLVWLLLIVGHAFPLHQWSSQPVEQQQIVNQQFLKPFQSKGKTAEPQLLSAKFALANGHYTGQGWRQGEQTQYQKLPYAYSDLIFAAFSEEWGFLGAITLMLLYTTLTVSMIVMSAKVENRFASLCMAGVAIMLMGQVFIHVGYTTGLLPMTGITLPFMSAGGTALFTTWMGIPLVHSCSRADEY